MSVYYKKSVLKSKAVEADSGQIKIIVGLRFHDSAAMFYMGR
jgi:hypothetical protein